MKGEFPLWAICAVLVLAAHGAVGLALRAPRPAPDVEAGSSVVLLDLAPLAPVAEPPPAPVEPPPEARETQPPPDIQPAPEPTASADRPDPTPPPPVASPEPETAPAAEPVKVAEATPTPVRTQEATPPPPVEAPPPPPPPPDDVQAAPDADPGTQAASAPAPGREDAKSEVQIQSWERDMIAQIERHKRFPAAARGKVGVVSVAFRIDRQGRLIESHVLQSSGNVDLDRAALELIQRAQPFPAPPAAFSDEALSFVAPIRYLKPARP